ncbi:MAG TPA: serine/threonine-protein kinase, partial [Polyangiaceae bacterium]|nr:serine/threonine-protein kinase [Polyangiaceae bacterium]
MLQSGLESEQSAFGEYERLQLLGEGAMGAVYLARHRASEELVALKVARRELLERPGGFELFRRQGKTESALKHPNIVHVQGAGTCGGQPFLVMPLMEGGTLAEPERAAQYATPEARLQLVLKLARAVQFAHERGILHCDLKHDNILFDGEGEAHVSDFGLACTLDAAGAGDVEGVRGGTRGWMAPEQVTGDPLTTAADAFALGVLLHWLGTRQLPFGSDEEFERRVLCGPPPAAGDWSPELEWGLRAIAEKALQIRAEERYESPAALADDLVRLRDQRPLAGAKTPMLARAWLWTERHRGARNALFLLMPCFAALTFVLALAQRHELRAAVLSMNAYAASGQAATVLYQLREYANAIEHAAADP